MNRLVALRSGLQDAFYVWLSMPKPYIEMITSSLKQQLLLADQIGILNLDEFDYMLDTFKDEFTWESRAEMAHYRLILRWLNENNIIFQPNPQLTENELKKTSKSMRELQSKLRQKDEIMRRLTKKSNKTYSARNLANTFEAKLELESLALRIMSLRLEESRELATVTTLSYKEYVQELPNLKRGDVAQIILNKLPLPKGSTHWEQIIDYRNDPENQKNLLALRRWIRKISTEELSRAEIDEEIEWLIHEFQAHMKYHKIKANTETLEVLVKAPLEIIEDLVKLKLSKLTEPFFALKKRNLLLMEAEMNAPGKELAYIIKSRETFESQE